MNWFLDPSLDHSSQRPIPELLVHLRHSDLKPGSWSAELHDGSPLSGATFRRIACDSGVVPVMVDDKGEPLDVGRRRRTVPPSVRRALLVRDRCCRFPGCQSQLFVESHHIEHWCEGGETSKANLLHLCHAHHVALHEGGLP